MGGGVGCVEDQPQYIYSHSGDTVMTRMFVLAVAFVVGMVFSTAGALGQCPTDNTPCAWKEGRTVNIGGQFYNPVTRQIETCSLRIYSCYRCCPSNGDVSFEITLSKVEFLNPDCAQNFTGMILPAKIPKAGWQRRMPVQQLGEE
jgi:hypothetical protein